MSLTLDNVDRRILRALQKDSSVSQRELADIVGMSQNACWRRLTVLRESGLILNETVRLDPVKLGLKLSVFMMVRTRHHSHEWLELFCKIVTAIPNVIDFYRIAGNYDYMIKVVAADMADFDTIYQRLVSQVDLDSVTSYITMETITDRRDLPV
ncbi:Lrp/AsnC family transcriptional regulator [Gluconacetobacter asukensis]|uniref:Lrp/AsnC family transcriptional regulator n=1 Tax=Gluconacetobacter asukensis TaxID=1017181 RepID=A0A7W4IZD2_9PROT|nr:Lrp/AsnC family transcriptional regulator [Gluconacetobacter asukensis]MBB2171801.1 Lrp/AsnC family transcriptional regulator [Gluconacetobacter asukensis]